MAALVADFFRARAEIVIGVGAVGIASFRPPVLVPIAGIGGVGVRECEISLGLRVVGGLVRQVNFLAVFLFHFLVHVGHVNGDVFVGGGRRKEHEKVVAFLRGNFGGGAGREVHQVDIVHHYVGIVLLPPFLRECAVEPGVV